VGYKRAGLGKGLPPEFMGPNAIMRRGMTDLFFEESTEGADAFKAYLVADLCYGQLVGGKTLSGLFDPFAGEVLMGGQLIDPGEQPVKMIPGQTGLPGQAIEVDRFREIAIDIQLSRNDLFIYV
jgi:hypothetical protein